MLSVAAVDVHGTSWSVEQGQLGGLEPEWQTNRLDIPSPMAQHVMRGDPCLS
jgi:hypothetical protein